MSEAATKEVGKIEVANCTFNQVTATTTSSNNSGIFHIRYTEQAKPDSYMKLGSLKLTKCVFLNELSATEDDKGHVRMARNNNENFAPTCEGNYYYNVGPAWFDIAKCYQTDGTLFSEKLALDGDGAILTDDPCTNSIAGKMYLKPNSAIAANKAGDPRWWNASAPVIVRPTELETVTEATEWDFTDKTKFDTETIESNQIIENIRIYAPAEVEMTKGVTFGAAATLSIKNEPLTSALAFNADGYGAVEVTAQGTGITSTIQILAGGDAYSINADGKTHKVVFGDLVGANNIYILPSVPGITFTKVAWTKDITPEDMTEQLATPEITWTPDKVNAGTSAEAVASWKAVQGAASYTVVFNGSTTTITETTYTVPAATVAALAAGDYEISVVAKPTATSTRFTASEAGKASFKIKEVVVGVEKTVTWDFTQFDGTNLTGETWSGAAFGTDVVWNVNAACPLTIMNGVQCDGNQAKMQNGSSFSNGSTPDKRALYFKAPGPGTLTIVHKSANSSDATRKSFVSVNGKVTETTPSPTTEWGSVEVDLSNIEADQIIYVFANSNNFQSVSYKYTAGPQTIMWDFGSDDFINSEAKATIGTADNKEADATYNGLHIQSLGSNVKVEERGEGNRLRTGGGSSPTSRAIWFEVPVACSGTLKVNGTNPSSSTTEETTLTFTAQHADGTTIGSGTHVGTGYKDCTILDDVDLTAGEKIYICCSGGYRYASISFTFTEKTEE